MKTIACASALGVRNEGSLPRHTAGLAQVIPIVAIFAEVLHSVASWIRSCPRFHVTNITPLVTYTSVIPGAASGRNQMLSVALWFHPEPVLSFPISIC